MDNQKNKSLKSKVKEKLLKTNLKVITGMHEEKEIVQLTAHIEAMGSCLISIADEIDQLKKSITKISP